MCGGGILGPANDEKIAPTGLLFHNNTVKPTNNARPSVWGALKLFLSNIGAKRERRVAGKSN